MAAPWSAQAPKNKTQQSDAHRIHPGKEIVWVVLSETSSGPPAGQATEAPSSGRSKASGHKEPHSESSAAVSHAPTQPRGHPHPSSTMQPGVIRDGNVYINSNTWSSKTLHITWHLIKMTISGSAASIPAVLTVRYKSENVFLLIQRHSIGVRQR